MPPQDSGDRRPEDRGGRRGLLLAGFIALQALLGAAPAAPGTDVPAAPGAPMPAVVPEYHLKAGYLLKFTRYVEWPESAFASPEAPLVIGVLGADPFGAVLEETVAGQSSHHRPIVVRRMEGVEEAAGCHVVFIARRQERKEAAWLAALQDRPVLTVADGERGLELGAVLAFALDESRGSTRVVFLASQAAARRAGLQLSASMLMHARKVIREPGKPGGGR